MTELRSSVLVRFRTVLSVQYEDESPIFVRFASVFGLGASYASASLVVILISASLHCISTSVQRLFLLLDNIHRYV